jgi:2'-5' RNA ligase
MAPKRCGKDRSLDNAHAGSYANGVAIRKGLPLAVESVVLMKSELKPTGSVYTRLWDVRLRG